MIMIGRLHLLALALASPAVASAQVVQNVHGDVAHFGEGFTAIMESRVDFRLLRPAHVVLVWVTPDGRIDLFFPVRSRSEEHTSELQSQFQLVCRLLLEKNT